MKKWIFKTYRQGLIWRAENKRGILFFNRIVIFIFWNVKWYATTQRFGLDLCPLTVHAQCLHPLRWCTVDNPRYNVHQFMAHTVRKVCILSVGSLGSALIPMSPPHPARTKNFSKMVMMMMVMTLVTMIMPRSLRRLYHEYPESYHLSYVLPGRIWYFFMCPEFNL